MLRLVRLACNVDAPPLPRLASNPVFGDSFSSFWSRSISSTPTICGRSATSPPPTTSTTTAAAAAGHVRSSPAPQLSRSRHTPLFMSTRGYPLLQHRLQPISRTLPMVAVSWPSAPFSASATASSASPPSPSSSDIDEPESAPAASPSAVAQEGVYEFDGDIPQDLLTVRFARSGGPGGQHVNKTSTKVDLRFQLDTADWLSSYTRQRMAKLYKSRINKEGEFVVTSTKTRSQTKNLEDALAKLREMCRSASYVAPGPSPEAVSRAAKRERRANERRLQEKRHHQLKKERRRRVGGFDD